MTAMHALFTAETLNVRAYTVRSNHALKFIESVLSLAVYLSRH
jgi:hypothetical protein